MDDRRVTLPDQSSIRSTAVRGYSLEDDGLTVRLWIDRQVDAEGPVRVFTSESVDTVAVLVVPTPPKYAIGRTCDWSQADREADVADLVARLNAPLGDRRLEDASTGFTITPLAPWILKRQAEHPAPRLRPIGPLSSSHPLAFRGEI